MENAALDAKLKQREEAKVTAREAKLMKKAAKLNPNQSDGEKKEVEAKSSNEVPKQ